MGPSSAEHRRVLAGEVFSRCCLVGELEALNWKPLVPPPAPELERRQRAADDAMRTLKIGGRFRGHVG